MKLQLVYLGRALSCTTHAYLAVPAANHFVSSPGPHLAWHVLGTRAGNSGELTAPLGKVYATTTTEMRNTLFKLCTHIEKMVGLN